MASNLVHQRVASARLGENPTVVCRMRSGFLVMCDKQTPRGWCILLSDPVVADLDDLGDPARIQFLTDMADAGQAIKRVTGAARMNYSILGNTDPALHAHLQPRFADEPAELKSQPLWAIWKHLPAVMFDVTRESPLMAQIRAELIRHAKAIDARL